MRKGDGFTLIELLIVLAILGILVGIVAMSVDDLNTTAQTRGIVPGKQLVQAAVGADNSPQVEIGNGTINDTRAVTAVAASASLDAPAAS